VVVGTVIGGLHTLLPRDAGERGGFARELLMLHWIRMPGGDYNLVAILGILAALAILVVMLRPQWETHAVVIFAVLSIPLSLAAFWVDWLVCPYTHFAARYNSGLMSLPLGALFLVARGRASVALSTTGRSVRAIVVLLGLTASLWHVTATERWSAFLGHFATVLRSQHGIIAWDSVLAPPGSRNSVLGPMMVWAWTNPIMSVVALPRFCVSSIVDDPSSVPKESKVYDVANIKTMTAFPNVKYTYLLPPDEQAAACAAPTAIQPEASHDDNEDFPIIFRLHPIN
jgi:hypothetical protein